MIIYGVHSVKGAYEFKPHLIRQVWRKPSIPKNIVQLEHQGIAADINETGWIHTGAWEFKSHPGIQIYVCVDHIEDPQNLGAIARAAALLGAGALVFPQDRQASITPAVVKASSGMIFALELIQVVNLTSFLTNFKKQAHGWVYGLQLEGARSISELQAGMPCGLVVGSEGKGISRGVVNLCDALYVIPMVHDKHTLNVSQAAAIGLFQISQSRTQ